MLFSMSPTSFILQEKVLFITDGVLFERSFVSKVPSSSCSETVKCACLVLEGCAMWKPHFLPILKLFNSSQFVSRRF